MNPRTEGDRIPDVTFRLRENGEWVDTDTTDLFAGRNVVCFALPGAFTPTCSASHLPRYEELAAEFSARGLDAIYCISVNDGFVMEAWGREQGAEHVRLIADGNGEFSAAMGMLVDKSALGFGQRSWRYSMLVRDGVIERMFVEPQGDGDPYEVSDADTMLRHLDPGASARPTVALFTRRGCPHCARAKATLEAHGWSYEEIAVGPESGPRALRAVTGAVTVPQVFIDGERIGSADDLEQWFAEHAAA